MNNENEFVNVVIKLARYEGLDLYDIFEKIVDFNTAERVLFYTAGHTVGHVQELSSSEKVDFDTAIQVAIACGNRKDLEVAFPKHPKVMFATKKDIESWCKEFLIKNDSGQFLCPFENEPVTIVKVKGGNLMIDKFCGKIHLCENIYFDLTSGNFQELTNIQGGVISEKLDNEKEYATFGCLTNEDGVFLDNVVFPAIISCGDVRANGKKVYSIDDIRNVFVKGGQKINNNKPNPLKIILTGYL